jgi:hypothetical protein
MPTLWQRFKNWWSPPPPPPVEEEKVFNPLKCRIEKSTLLVDTLELRKYTFRVNRMVEYKLDYGDKKFHFMDYYCRSTLQEGDPIHVKVRVYPHDQPGHQHQILVLREWDEFEYNDDFKAVVDTGEEFNLTNEDVVEATFWRINDIKTPYKAQTTDLSNVGVAVKAKATETWYWDYWRETKDEGGSDYKEFLMVEWDKGDTGMFTIWRGEEISPNCVTELA